jgi:hypothetical protein
MASISSRMRWNASDSRRRSVATSSATVAVMTTRGW